MSCRQLNGFTGTNHQGGLLVKLAKNLFRQAHRGKGNRYRARAYGGIGANLLGNGKSMLEQFTQQAAHGALLIRLGIGLFHLAQNLRFTQYQ